MYAGQLFRSGLEAQVAAELDSLGVAWGYEILPEVGIECIARAGSDIPRWKPWYLPDFTIFEAEDYLELPLWLEVKPADLLYAVRDACGLGERFTATHTSRWTANDLQFQGFLELAKPKRCAEIYGYPVLVASQINRVQTLSITLDSDAIFLQRDHPCVNRKGIVQAEQRRERQEAWGRAWQERQADFAKQRVRDEHALLLQQSEMCASARLLRKPARYGDRCAICRIERSAQELTLARLGGRWHALCRIHVF